MMHSIKTLFMMFALLLCGITSAWGAQQVTISPPTNGQVTISPEAPTAGQTVTITVKPAKSYCIHKADIVVKKTTGTEQSIVGDIEISGTEPADLTLQANYTFTMPEEPYGVNIAATFSESPYFNIKLNPMEHGSVRPSSMGNVVQLSESEYQSRPGTYINITPYPDDGYDVANVSVTFGSEQICNGGSFVMPYGDVVVDATFAPVLYSIIKGDGITHGEISLDKTQAHMNDEVSVTATPEVGYEVERVYISYTRNGGVVEQTLERSQYGTYDFVMPNNDVTVYAMFKIKEYGVNVAPLVNGRVIPSKEKATYGEKVTLTVTADDGYLIKEVSYSYYVGGQSDLTYTIAPDKDGVYQFNMPAADVTVRANFDPLPFYLVGTILESGWDRTRAVAMTPNGDKTYTYNAGHVNGGAEFMVITRQADGGPTYGTINENPLVLDIPKPVSDSEEYYFMIELPGVYSIIFNYADMTVELKGKTDNYLTLENVGHGTSSLSKTAAVEGDEIIVTATPDEGYEVETVFYRIDDEGTTQVWTLVEPDENGVYKFTMPDDNVIVKVTFIPYRYNITLAQTEHGTVIVREKAAEGTTVSLKATPDEGYEITAIEVFSAAEPTKLLLTVKDKDEEFEDWYVFVMPGEDVIVKVTFSAVPHTVTVAEGVEHGTVTLSKNTAIIGETISITATPETGYEVDKVYISYDTPSGLPTVISLERDDNGMYDFTMPAADVTVKATFVPAPLRGDLNRDGSVDVEDVDIVVNIILGKDKAENYDGRADLDNNGKIDVSDVNAIVNIILGKV